MAMLRRSFHDRLAAIEDELLSMGEQVDVMIEQVLEALRNHDVELAAQVIRADDRIDASYYRVQEEALTTLALQAPVAGDLRLVSALLHANLHLERIGDLCVNIAKFVQQVERLMDDAELTAQLHEMGGHSRRVVRRALESFSRRDVEAARQLPVLDDPIDQLNKGLFRRLVKLAADDQLLDWAMRMVLVARYLERIGDHAVDIAEQTIFLVTGEAIELTSNSPRET